MSIESQCQREVEELHAFFDAWCGGACEHTEAKLARFSGVLAPEFVIVSATGGVMNREQIVSAVRSNYAGWSNERGETDKPLIWIEDFNIRQSIGDVHIATYEEWQQRHGATRGRISTAIFQPAEASPNGVQWLHVHESWLEDGH